MFSGAYFYEQLDLPGKHQFSPTDLAQCGLPLLYLATCVPGLQGPGVLDLQFKTPSVTKICVSTFGKGLLTIKHI